MNDDGPRMARPPGTGGPAVPTLHLRIAPDAYELCLNGTRLARLPGGAAALLAGAGTPLREADIERAIVHAEDWLMPASRALQGLALHLQVEPARLRAALGDASVLTPHEVEAAFTRAHDAVAHGRPLAREAVADAVLVRELVHHGALVRVVWAQG